MEIHRDGLYVLLHRGLRARLCGVLEELGRVDWSEPSQCERAVAGLLALLTQLDLHEVCEDRVLHAAMEACQSGSSAATAGDHASQADARQALRAEAERLRAMPLARRASAGGRLERRLALYLADFLEHMLCEELENAPFLRARLGGSALAELERESLQLLSADMWGQLLAWTLPAIAANERAWLQRIAIDHCCGEPVFSHEKGLAA